MYYAAIYSGAGEVGVTDKGLTTLEYALLGILGMSPMSGYDIHKLFASTPLAHFSSSPGAIYPALRRLERRTLVKAQLDSRTEARPRRVYSLTKAGEAALKAWLHQSVTRQELIRGAGAPILRFGLAEGRLSREQVVAYLEGYRREVKRYLEELEDHQQGLRESGLVHGRLSLEHGIRSYQSQLDWIDHAIAEIKRTRCRRAGPARAAEVDHRIRRRKP